MNNNESVKQVADDLGLNSKTLYHWGTSYKKEHNIPIRDYGMSSSTENEQEELKRLRRENKILKQAKKEIFEYIEFYFNRIRSHSYLGNLSPSKFEEVKFMLQNEMVAYG